MRGHCISKENTITIVIIVFSSVLVCNYALDILILFFIWGFGFLCHYNWSCYGLQQRALC